MVTAGDICCKLTLMNSSKSVVMQRTIVVTPEGLSRLVIALPFDMDLLKFSMICADGTRFTPTEIDELLRFPNSRTREIQEIEISTSYGSQTRCEITFSTEIIGPATFEVSGEDAFVVATADLIQQHIESMDSGIPGFISNSYVFREVSPFLVFFIGGSLGVIGYSLCWAIFKGNEHPQIGSFVFGRFTSWMIMAFALAFMYLAIKFESLLLYFFPKVSFCIGDGAARYKRMTERRKLFGLAALVSLVIGITGRLLVNMMLAQ